MTISSRYASAIYMTVLLFAVSAPELARSQEAAPPAVGPTGMARPRSPLEADPALSRAVTTHRRAQANKHFARAQRISEKRNFEQAAHEFAVAYIFEPRPEVLLEVARACRKAEMDAVAQALFVRVRDELPLPQFQTEIEEALQSFDYSIENAELNLTETLRSRLDLAKQEFLAGHFSRAVVEYALAYSIKRLPRLVFNTAQAYRRDNRAEEAYILYANFLEEEPDAPIRKEVLGYLRELRAAAFPPALYKRPIFWIPLVSSIVAVAAIGFGVAYGLPKPQQVQKPVLMFDFP